MIKILLVDDEPSALLYLRKMIEQKCPGYSVTGACENGAEALESLKKLCPDVVLTDIRMPVMDGLELTGRLHRQYPRVKVVIISGYQDFTYARTALQYGVHDYLLKPLTPRQLQSLLEGLAVSTVENRAKDLAALISALMHEGEPVDQGEVSRLFPYKQYIAALFRKNEAPARTESLSGKPDQLKQHSIYDALPPKLCETAIAITPHSSRENVLFWPCAVESPEKIKDLLTEAISSYDNDFYTVIVTAEAFVTEDMRAVLQRLQAKARHSRIIGLSQVILCDPPKYISSQARVDSELFFDAIATYIEDNLAENMSLLSVCERFYISQTYLSRLFRKYADASFNEYLTKARIEESIRLIRAGTFTAREISEMVGFSNPTYFSRVFKSITGFSPSCWSSEL